jgi:predicted aspartyl protease
MIAGAVDDDLVPLIDLAVSGLTGKQVVEARIDTAFNGFLSLPLSLLLALGLTSTATQWTRLADGSLVQLPVFFASVDWDGRTRTVQTDATADLCLVGMSLMEGHDLSMRIRPGGALTIQAIP